ncbi:Tat pathway signal protein [Proteiniphilum sp. UBA5375]|uniref:Tat pathway signal protein n=1 Tax=Proteiniphilum sp. UBA5375 TaxID=1947278 RepID=UPI00257AE039|nr:Tat pathway signal protein [Proteiniphilum sp. UBA5375]
MTNRREFIKQVTAASIAAAIPGQIFAQRVTKKSNNELIWANLLHLSYNMWEDNTPLKYQTKSSPSNDCLETRMWAHCYQPELTFDKNAWDQLLKKMVDAGMNMVIIDLGDGVKYDSHPEIAVTGAWSPQKLMRELKKIREMGLEPIPKLNFSTGHKAWLGPYQRMISSDKYYAVCKNLIEEVCSLFDTPRFFHLGMDEETAVHQRNHENMVVRQGELWWHDFYYLVDLVEKQNVRPWIWSDYAWDHPDLFFEKMPKSVLQSNWYYGSQFENISNPLNEKYVRLYDQLEAHGFDQIPTGSNHSNDVNFGKTVEHCSKIISADRLKGFMQTTWRPTLAPCFKKHCEAIEQVANAIG